MNALARIVLNGDAGTWAPEKSTGLPETALVVEWRTSFLTNPSGNSSQVRPSSSRRAFLPWSVFSCLMKKGTPDLVASSRTEGFVRGLYCAQQGGWEAPGGFRTIPLPFPHPDGSWTPGIGQDKPICGQCVPGSSSWTRFCLAPWAMGVRDRGSSLAYSWAGPGANQEPDF